jgi:hypothetical protein
MGWRLSREDLSKINKILDQRDKKIEAIKE